MSNNKKNDNELLVEFEFLVDLDIAMFKYIQSNFSDSEYVDKKIIRMRNDYYIINKLLYRDHINPLEIIMPDVDTTKLYCELHDDKEEELLKYALYHDTMFLMNTFIENASSVGITILCRNELESEFIKRRKNNDISIIIESDKSKLDLRKYTAIYTKFAASVIEYGHIEGKYIYIAAARYNLMLPEETIDPILTVLYGELNIIKLMDLYTKVKFMFKGENYDDIFKYSFGEQSKEDTTRST